MNNQVKIVDNETGEVLKETSKQNVVDMMEFSEEVAKENAKRRKKKARHFQNGLN